MTNPPVPLLEIRNLSVDISVRGSSSTVLNDISLSVGEGEAVGLVGESGSGKSLTLKSLIGLLPPNARITDGSVRFRGTDILSTGPHGGYLSSVRGAGISMVFQEPATALNPVLRVGQQMVDAIAARRGLSAREARSRAVELMDQVGIVDPQRRVDAYPFELSGGMRQRVMIAAAIAQEPALLLCDEPTTALDVTVQAQILRLFARLLTERGLGLLYVTHDLGVVAQMCTRVAVMRQGRIVESGGLQSVFDEPRDDYTKKLLRASPRIVRTTRATETEGSSS